MYTKLLVGTDGSATAAKAVDRAVDVAKAAGASLTIMSAGKGAKPESIVEAEAARHKDAGIPIDTKVVEGEPVATLIDVAAKDGHDLLVLGNRGMTGVTRYFRLGSVPNKVIHHHLPCSLLIVKTT
jgi:nucleotide-binding universal stress UspA family protein